MKYLLLDTHNLFHRSKHVVHGDAYTKSGLALHVIFSSILKSWNLFGADHLVVALEGRSWRKEIYPPYKANRVVKDNLKSAREREDDEIFFEVMDDFVTFITEKTNCTTLQSQGLEADDFIARWCQTHPDDEHVIISSDTDFYQLLAPNVTIYNGVKMHHITLDGVTDEKGDTVMNKLKTAPLVFDPVWELFKKCMKGDPGDGIWPAHVPRTRETKIRAAFDDRDTKGYSWNNLVLDEWEDHEGVKDTVYNRYIRNVELVDLTQQPAPIKQLMDNVIDEQHLTPPRNQIGWYFMKFCAKHDLININKYPEPYAKVLSAVDK